MVRLDESPGLHRTRPDQGYRTSQKRRPLANSILTADQVETLLNVPDVDTKLGLRDRAILETFYSSGIRCGELIALDVYDISFDRGILTVR